MKIDKFRGEYSWCSNFYVYPVELDGVIYSTIEHAYQAAKTLNLKDREYIRLLEKPGQAKQAGKKLKIRADWENVKISIMKYLVRQKFNDATLAAKLLETNDAEIIEGNTWGDVFWGVCRGEGQNHLGKILMEIRDEVKNTKSIVSL